MQDDVVSPLPDTAAQAAAPVAEDTSLAPQDLVRDLGKLLDRYDQNRRALEARVREVRTEEAEFRAAFVELRDRVLRPAFVTVAAVLRARGHEFGISQVDHAVEPAGRTTEAGICLHVMLAGARKPAQDGAEFPSLSFVTRNYSKTVCVTASNAPPQNSGTGVAKGGVPMSRIDLHFVNDEVLKFVAALVEA